MGLLHDYEDVNRFGSPRSIERGTKQRGKGPAKFGRFNAAPGIVSVLQRSQECLQDSQQLLRSPRSAGAAQCKSPPPSHDAGVPSNKTSSLANHQHSPRGPHRMNPCNLEEFVSSPRRQLQRGASCPPRTDPITHTSSPRTDPLALRALDYGHLATRQRALRRNGYTAQSATGKLDLKTHDQTSSALQQQVRTASSGVGLNSSSLMGEEHLMPSKVRTQASDKEMSARYTKVNTRQQLTFIDTATIGGSPTIGGYKARNPSLVTSTDMSECMAGGSSQPPSRRSSPPASVVGSANATTGSPSRRFSPPASVTGSQSGAAPRGPSPPASVTGSQSGAAPRGPSPPASEAGSQSGAAAVPAAGPPAAGQRRPSALSSASSASGASSRQPLKLFHDPMRA